MQIINIYPKSKESNALFMKSFGTEDILFHQVWNSVEIISCMKV